MHSCCPCIVLLFVVQFEFEFFEFEFNLNLFESFQKWKSLPFSPLLFSPLPVPARFLFFPPRPNRRPSLPLPRPVSLSPGPSPRTARSVAPLSCCHRQAGPTCRGLLLPRVGRGLCRVRPHHTLPPRRLDAHAKDSWGVWLVDFGFENWWSGWRKLHLLRYHRIVVKAYNFCRV